MRAAAGIVLAAREAGVLPASTSLDVSRNNLIVRLPGYFPADLEASARAVAWFRETFPGAEINERARHCIVRPKRGRPAVDRVEVRARTEEGLIQLWGMGPHECGDYRGAVLDGRPRWYCGRCRKAITVTRARELGLLPPKPPAPKRPRQLKLPIPS